jgi:hypothetical protein
MAKRNYAQVASMNVSIFGFRERSQNAYRINIAQRLVEMAGNNLVDLLAFPAGYLLARDESEIPKLIWPIIETAKKQKISFTLGVDTQAILHPKYNQANAPAMHKLVAEYKVPCHIACYSREIGSLTLHRQRSCTNYQAERRMAPMEAIAENCIMKVAGFAYSHIHCGELYHLDLFTRGPQYPKAKIIYGHSTMTRLPRSLLSRSLRGFSLINSEHRQCQGGMLYNYSDGENKSIYAKPCFVDRSNGFFVDMAIWKLGKQGFYSPSFISKGDGMI